MIYCLIYLSLIFKYKIVLYCKKYITIITIQFNEIERKIISFIYHLK